MFCRNCGKEIEDGATFCPECGASQQQPQSAPPQQPVQQPYAPQTTDASSFGFAFLCFLFPIVGLILYLVWKDTLPLRAKSCGKGAIVGVIVGVVFSIIYSVMIALAAGAAAGAAGAGIFY